ncbi:MAG TPA: DsbA family protein [Candidatus Agrococcus pullicola]|uniref:DsbA family protein n=1 Tax=Candidatus Agrococcus pullicola TaxID=2838429 RepID=A0A9D2CB08_9MICO|nr:DsbA family protein [Candidatus Agrococcus pullicola]
MIEVDVWADVRCPWCWIGSRRLRRAADVAGVTVRVRHRSFLLEPDGPVSPGLTTAHVATTEWGLPAARWEAKSQQIRAQGSLEGLDIDVDGALMFDSHRVHRLLKVAAASADIDTDLAWDAAFAAQFSQGADLGDQDVLSGLALGWGLSDTAIADALTNERYAAQVDEDIAEAQSLPVASVPTIVTADGERISGASSLGDLVAFLTRVGAGR